MARALPLLACGLVCLLLLARGLGSEVLAGGDLLIFSYPRYALLGERLAAALTASRDVPAVAREGLAALAAGVTTFGLGVSIASKCTPPR